MIMQTEKAFAEQTVEVDSIFGLRDGATDMVVYMPEESISSSTFGAHWLPG